MDFASKGYWFNNFSKNIQPNPFLNRIEYADISIIGGGFTGLSTAYHIKKINPHLNVMILEQELCGSGESGRNAGFLKNLFGLSRGISKFRYNTKKVEALHKYMKQAFNYSENFINSNNIDCNYEKTGYFNIATNDAQIARLENDFEFFDKLKIYNIEKWSDMKLRNAFNTGFYKLALFDPDCAMIDPAKLVREMKKIVENQGVVIFENSPLRSFIRDSKNRFLIQTNQGEIISEFLVFASSAYSSYFPEFKYYQIPLITHMVLTEKLSDKQLDSINWKIRSCVEDQQHIPHYCRLTSDNRLLMGGGNFSIHYSSFIRDNYNYKIFNSLEKHIIKVFPQLKGINITHKWGYPVSATFDMNPVIGHIGSDKKAIFSIGSNGRGLSLAILNGKTIAELICNQDTINTGSFVVGRKFMSWPMEPFKFVMSNALLSFMKYQDKL